MAYLSTYLTQLILYTFDPSTPSSQVAIAKGFIWLFSAIYFVQFLDFVMEIHDIYKGTKPMDLFGVVYYLASLGGLWVTTTALIWWNPTNVRWALGGITINSVIWVLLVIIALCSCHPWLRPFLPRLFKRTLLKSK